MSLDDLDNERSEHPQRPHGLGVVDSIHDRFVGDRRLDVLSRRIAEMLPREASVLDVGCGDGRLSARIARIRPDCSFQGIDVIPGATAMIPVTIFDGQRIPMPDKSVDVAMLVDVLHHTSDPTVILAEAQRVSRRFIVLKDHRRNGFLAGLTLRVMDWVGNAHHGVSLPYNYWSEAQWRSSFSRLRLRPEDWRTQLGIHSPMLDPIVGRELHFLARLVTEGA